MHRGGAAKGVNHYNFKHGRYSKSMPDRLVSRYEQALADEERHDLRDEISLSEAKIDDLLSKMESGESDTAWMRMRALEAQMQRTGDDAKRAELLRQLLHIVRVGAEEALAWNDVDKWTSRKQRLVESDMKVAQVKQEMVSAEEVMAAFGMILDSIRRHVDDQATRAAVARDIRSLTSGDGAVVPIDRARGT
jgi:uncharacterized protein YjcR